MVHSQMAQGCLIVHIPSAGSGHGEDHHGGCHEHSSEKSQIVLEHVKGKGCIGCPGGPFTGNQHAERRNGTHNEGVHKYLKGSPEPLLHGMTCLAGGMDHRACTPAGLIGINTSLHAGGNGLGHRDSGKPAHGSCPSKGLGKDRDNGGNQVADVQHNDYQAEYQVPQTHNRHQLHKYLA